MVIHKKTAETGILFIALGLFVVSTYSFVSASKTSVVAANVVTADDKATSSRAPASAVRNIPKPDSGYIPYQTRCERSENFETQSGKIRIIGPLCGLSTVGETKNFLFKITNNTNTYVATVFQDYKTRTFSTDFIPLQYGDNSIQMQFDYGKRSPANVVELKIKRNR